MSKKIVQLNEEVTKGHNLRSWSEEACKRR